MITGNVRAGGRCGSGRITGSAVTTFRGSPGEQHERGNEEEADAEEQETDAEAVAAGVVADEGPVRQRVEGAPAFCCGGESADQRDGYHEG